MIQQQRSSYYRQLLLQFPQISRFPNYVRDRLERFGNDSVLNYWLAPWAAMENPDQWQTDVLTGLITLGQHSIICCSRGAGKSEVVSCAAYLEACLGGRVVVFSNSDRQAKEEIFDKVIAYHRRLNLVPQERVPTFHDLRLISGGRVLSLPCSEDTVVGKHKISLLIIDEAAKVPDRFYARVTPMIATLSIQKMGRLCLLSTPFGRRGFFWKEWSGKGRKNWRKYGPITWEQCPRISEEHIEAERLSHSDWWVKQEYGCEFLSEQSSFFGDLVDNFDGLVDPNLHFQYS